MGVLWRLYYICIEFKKIREKKLRQKKIFFSAKISGILVGLEDINQT